MFLRNAWYVACTSKELGREGLLARTLCGERLVLFRDAQGQVAALGDFCPRRGVPLSLGRVIVAGLRCGYHGLLIDCDGAPRAMPGQRLAGIPHVRSFAVVERHDFVWLWPGDPALAAVAALSNHAASSHACSHESEARAHASLPALRPSTHDESGRWVHSG